MTKRKTTNNDLQNITQKTKDQATQTPLKTGLHSGAQRGQVVPSPHVAPTKFDYTFIYFYFCRYDPFLTKEFPCPTCKLDINPHYRHLL
jgi:hypothetical protein